MKKIYIAPELERIVLDFEHIMVGASDLDHADGKDGITPWDYIDDDEELDSKFSWSVWGDEDEEEDI